MTNYDLDTLNYSFKDVGIDDRLAGSWWCLSEFRLLLIAAMS